MQRPESVVDGAPGGKISLGNKLAQLVAILRLVVVFQRASSGDGMRDAGRC